jgi:cyclic-di-GMP phosphodiesterase, flagellum assembly factor TipF
MHLRQKSSRYCAAVLFLAGLNCVFLLAAIITTEFQPGFEIWLASALVASLILHARAGFALTDAEQEIELLHRQTEKIHPAAHKRNGAPVVKLDPAKDFAAKEIDAKDVDVKDARMLALVKDAIEYDRIDLYLQPIVSLPQRKQRYFEAFSRLRNEDGTILRPIHYLEAAERANRIGVIDNMILLRAVQALRNLGTENKHYRIFCNISPATIYDQDFFARFTDYLDVHSDLAPRLVFEFTYPAVKLLTDRAERNLQAIAERGYAFSVDHISRLDHNWSALQEKNFHYVKASSKLLLSASRGDPQSRARVTSFKETLCDNDIDLIVEKVELEADMPEILGLDIDFGQGALFGAPRPANVYIPPRVALAKAS